MLQPPLHHPQSQTHKRSKRVVVTIVDDLNQKFFDDVDSDKDDCKAPDDDASSRHLD